MLALDRPAAARPTTRATAIWLAVGLAFFTTLAYLLIGQGILGVGDVPADETTAVIPYVAAGGYLIGGLLIYLRWRWLWIVGVVINSLVLLMFFSSYSARPAVLLSPGGLISKASQIALEVAILYLIAANWLASRRETHR